MIVEDAKGAAATLLVTGVGGRSVGLQILLSLQMAKTRYRVVATDAEPFSFGLFSVDARYLVPYAHTPAYLPRMRDIVEREEVDVILPGTEAEVAALAPHAATIRDEWGVTLVAADADRISLCQDKTRLSEWLEANGHEPPGAERAANWRELVARVGYPLVAKPRTGSSGSRGVALLASDEEVEEYLTGREPETILVQEYVGDAETEFTVGVLAEPDGNVVDSIVLRRSLTGMSLMESRTIGGRRYALSTGYSQGFVVDNPLVGDFCERLVKALGLVGPVNVQCRIDADGSRVRVFEVHPRFSGSSAIRAEVGFNEADAMVRSWRLGEKFGRLDYRRNVACIRGFQTRIVPMEDYDALLAAGDGS